ncbi:MAG: ArsR family transcriptional regulator [Bacteroidetes bacterium]|nr:ArsR family transcriptional regulator [Bacteroidota bacterium]
MLDTLITSKTRIKILLKFFLNGNASAYLRNLEAEFNESTNAIRVELVRFENAGLLKSEFSGNKKIFKANTQHPLFKPINNLIMYHIGFDQIIDKVIEKLGKVNYVFIVGDFANGIDNNCIDLLFIGKDINQPFLIELIEKVEKNIERRIRYLIYTKEEFEIYKEQNNKIAPLLLWEEV